MSQKNLSFIKLKKYQYFIYQTSIFIRPVSKYWINPRKSFSQSDCWPNVFDSKSLQYFCMRVCGYGYGQLPWRCLQQNVIKCVTPSLLPNNCDFFSAANHNKVHKSNLNWLIACVLGSMDTWTWWINSDTSWIAINYSPPKINAWVENASYTTSPYKCRVWYHVNWFMWHDINIQYG